MASEGAPEVAEANFVAVEIVAEVVPVAAAAVAAAIVGPATGYAPRVVITILPTETNATDARRLNQLALAAVIPVIALELVTQEAVAAVIDTITAEEIMPVVVACHMAPEVIREGLIISIVAVAAAVTMVAVEAVERAAREIRTRNVIEMTTTTNQIDPRNDPTTNTIAATATTTTADVTITLPDITGIDKPPSWLSPIHAYTILSLIILAH